jgi:two-component system sensor histidine kinase UhpB
MNEPKGPLQVLIVEDSENDAELLELELERAGYEPRCHRVETPAQMGAALQTQPWQVVIADYVLPQFSGLAALALVKQKGLDIPFIVVSGHITEDTAVAAMKAGAHDYVMKDNLARLGQAVERELREADERHRRRRSEETLKVEHALTRILAHAESLEEAAPEIVHLLLDGLEMDLAILWLQDGQTLRPFACESRSESPALKRILDESRGLTCTRGVGLPGRAWQEGKAIWDTEFAENNAERSALFSQAGLRSAMAFPIQRGNDFLAVLEFVSTERRTPDPNLLNMMTAIGSEIGQFIKRRRAEEDLRRAHDELEVRVQQRTAELKSANARLEAAIRDRKRLENELLEITEKERRRIGLDLHDDLGQKLSGIALMTKGLENRLIKLKMAEAREAAKIHILVQQAMSHASDLAHDLATLDFKDNDLPAALSGLAEHAKELFEISCRFKAEEAIPPIEAATVGQLYKIAQEAVTNAIKHGKAKKVAINLANGSNRLVLTIQNDGLPFPDLRGDSAGMGLRIMNYRASLIGAALDVKGTGAHGTLVTCTVPVEGRK